MSNSTVDLEVPGVNKTHIDSPQASVSTEEEETKMENTMDMDGIFVSDAIRTEMESQALLEEARNRKTEFVPPLLPREVPPAPVLPPMPPFGVSQDFRYQQHSPVELGRGARQRNYVQGPLDYNVTPPPHQAMVNVLPEHARKDFLALEVEVRKNRK